MKIKIMRFTLPISLLFALLSFGFVVYAQDEAPTTEQNAQPVSVAPILNCDDLLAQAQAKIDEAKKLKGRSFVFQDKKMEEKADAMFAEADGMLATARTLGDECAAKVDQFENERKKRASGRRGSEEKKRPPEYY